ncbi:two component transcriptional regulator, LuxR family [Actinacidiphila alni]|uniref:Two component transcriptional regulator, LuxR family n=1 Tax=Actinacidiphila alni TaxID=380248 RepID=A0A1I2JFJ1_9ACTN|nr:response regulator transcription factor [Actinacidiphila alni]SFF51431.1 two component transcriptional regulator, LuxR family [Actinacidiphila alni]
MNESTVRVLLVDDDPLVRAGLKMMLRGADGIEVVGEVADGAAVPGAVRQHRPDVVLMDIRMPVMDGITATRALTGRDPAPQVIVLTTFGAEDTVLEAVRAGAAGYLLKHTEPEEIVAAVRRAAHGDPALSPDAARALIAHAASASTASASDTRAEAARARLAGLSERERAVAAAVAEGLSNTEIGARLHLSVGTVKVHLSSALGKAGVENRIQLALLAHDAGE